MRRGEALLWVLLVVALMSSRALPDFRPELLNDSVVYLSGAENVDREHLASTSIVNFDAERSFGVLPAPLVTFPSGLSLAIAAVAALGLDLQRAGLLVSMAGIATSVMLLLRLCVICELPVAASRAVAAGLVLNAGAVEHGVRIASEAPFLVCLLGFCALYLSALRQRHRWSVAVALAAAAGVAVGLGYWVRYAGLFIELALGALLGWYVLTRRWRPALLSAIALCAGGILIAAGALRNIRLVGNWRGGNELAVFNDPLRLAWSSLTAFDHLLFGSNVSTLTLTLRLASLALLVAAIRVLWKSSRGAATSPRRAAAPAFLFELMAILGVYCSLMLYAGLTTVISFGSRMFFPVLPILILVVALFLHWLLPASVRAIAADRRVRLLLTGALVGYFITGFVSSHAVPKDANPARINARLAARSADGSDVRAAIERLTGANGVVLANDGQMTGYVLQRPTVALVERHFTRVVWDEARVREVMERYGVSALVLSLPAAGEAREELLPSRFLELLAGGEQPAWLQQVASSSRLRVYRLAP